MKSSAKLFVLVLLLFSFACTKNKPKAEEEYASTLLLQLATTPSNALDTCITLGKKQTECLYAPLVAQGLTAPTVSDETYTSDCRTELSSSSFNTMSTIAQTCVLTCQDTDWKTKLASGECRTSTATSLVISSRTNTVVTRCIRSCFQTTNTSFSEADLPKLLIFNFIQNGD